MISAKVGNLFGQFLQEKRYVCNLSNATLDFYERSFKAFELPDELEALNQAQLNMAVVRMRSRGISASSVSAYSRGLQVFLNFLYENNFVERQLRLRKLKCEDKPIRTFSDAEVAALLAYKPRKKSEKRLLAILALCFDCGLRIAECIGLRRKNVDLENLLIDVSGKGKKFRRIPISIPCRKILYRHLQTHSHELIFCNRKGERLQYPNLRCELKALQKQLGISIEGAFHQTRRYFATYAIRHNQNPLLLQKCLGHSSLSMTTRYLKLETSDLSRSHVSALQTGGIR